MFIEINHDDCLPQFLEEIRRSAPPLARIDEIKISEYDKEQAYSDFIIIKSDDQNSEKVIVAPDIALCPECENELLNRKDRRFHYPFINCTNCGPRFTIIKDIPYDRINTTMQKFEMCPECQAEYEDPLNRRFHAQPNACGVCGPAIKLILTEDIGINKLSDFFKDTQANEDSLKKSVQLLKSGKILAIKGLGGYHLACDALNDNAVKKLRKRKIREAKPFAVMVKDIQSVTEICDISEAELKILTSYEKPILLLRKKKNSEVSEKISDSIAPNNPFLGIMLPYTPLHKLLFESSLKALVMTSGNKSQEPIYYTDSEGLEELSKIADAFLVHNRQIQRRCDDSVVRIYDKKLSFLRRARGYAPEPIALPFESKNILAVGAELKGTFCFGKERLAYLSHHLGDLENFETLKAFEEGISDFQKLFDLRFDYIAYDKHPDYLSTKYALAIPDNIIKIPVQHHHAHAAACMAEHNINEPVIGVIFDGTGYGEDDTIWGGEFLICDYVNCERAGHFENFILPGGEQGIKEPWRLAALWIEKLAENSDSKKSAFKKILNEEQISKWNILSKALQQGINAPYTSSAGRLFDSASAILGINHYIDYEGQAAIEMEFEAWKSDALEVIPVDIEEKNNLFILSPKNLLNYIIEKIMNNDKVESAKSDSAKIFHNSISESIIRTCLKLREKTGIRTVILSGGCFQNLLLLDMTFQNLNKENFNVYTNQILPPNDGCISFGQLAIAANKIK